ncbi:MAG: PAS domain S-box protein, partial [Candidatus Heimdallarchaeota archaeon]|nr:PAS domain S-box protein [Candidatus Heimdallarchaeota archaeon]
YLIDSIPDVIGELDLDGTISFVSPQVYDMLGYHPDEMVGTNIIKFIHPDDVQVIRKAIKKAIKSKEFVFPNLRLKHKRGTYILVVAKGKLLKLKDKTRLIGVLRDVTKLNETEKKLEESQNIFKHLNEVFLKFKEDPLFNLQFLINTAGLLLKADCALFNILKSVNGNEVIQSLVTYKEPLNFTRESNAKGHICTDIIKDNPDDVVILSNLDKTDYRKTDENVREYDLKQYVSYVVRFNNKPTATFCVVYTENREMSINDITILQILSKSASTELARWNSRNELQRSEEKYRRLINNLTDIILELDIKGTVTYVSPQCYTIMGYQPAEIIGKKVMGFIHPDDVMLIAEVMKKAIQTNEVVNVPSYRLLHKNGDSIYATASGRYVNLGGIEKFIAAIRDDRKSKKLEKEILLARDNLINILSSMEDGVYIVDQNYDIEYVNPILTKEFDLNEGKKCYKYFHDREEICPWCKNQEVFKGKTVRWEWFSEKNQKTYDLLDTPLKNRDGSISKLEIFRDITERKKTEKELR